MREKTKLKNTSPILRSCARRKPSHGAAGFSILEITIVLLIIALLLGMTAAMGRGKIEEAREIQTQMKLKKIEEALEIFRNRNNRLPCPGEQSDVSRSAGYGKEAAESGACTGGSPAASYIDDNNLAAEGMVPFSTLALTEEFAYDGWGRRFTYAVALRYTEPDAFENYTPNEACQAIQVQDAAGGVRTNAAVYVLISHGRQGHGGFNKAGQRYSENSTDAGELLNCNCTSAGTDNPQYVPQYVQKDMGEAAGVTFDDIVRYKERWQMQSKADQEIKLYNGPEAMLAADQSPYVLLYGKQCETYTRLASPSDVPSAPIQGLAVSPDNNYWAVTGNFDPMVYIYRRNSATGALVKLANPALYPAVVGRDVAFLYSNRDRLMLLAHDVDSGTGIRVSAYAMDTLTNSFVRLDPPMGLNVQPPSPVHGVVAHPVGQHMLVLHDTPPYYMNLYQRNGAYFFITPDNQAFSAPPAEKPVAAAFSLNGRYLALAYNNAPYLEVYASSVDGSTAIFTRVNAPAGAGPGRGVSFDYKSRYLALATASGVDSLNIYRIDLDTNGFTLQNAVNTSNAALYSAVFSPRQNTLLTSENAANSAQSMRYIPIENVFPLPSDNALPGLPFGSRVTKAVMRYKMSKEQ